jgi:uncharacterized membrane protein YozB (DUF420 family)
MSFTDLPAINATLNSLAALLLITGWVLIRRGDRVLHQRVMIAAFTVSVLFLISYLVYHSQVGSVRYQRTGPIRTVYFSILLTHTVLAAAVPFLAVISLYRGWRGRYLEHKRISRWTLPIWLYVSVTGVAVYWMLYRM